MVGDYRRLKRLLRELGDMQKHYLEYFHGSAWDEETLARLADALEAKREEVRGAREALDQDERDRGY